MVEPKTLTPKSLDKYVRFTRTTDLMLDHPSRGFGERLGYYALGLVGETGEFMSETDSLRLAKEAGDPLWYWARLLSAAQGVRGQSIADWLTSGALTPLWTIQGQVVCGEHRAPIDALFQLSLAGGRVCEQVKRVIRDDHSSAMVNERLETLLTLLADWLVCWYEALALHDLDPLIVLKQNSEKLTRRKSEGKLHGSGSDR